MTAADPSALARLHFLAETVGLEAGHLAITDARLFAEPFSVERVERVVHEYVRDATELAAALNAGHAHVPLLLDAATALRGVAAQRFGSH